MSETIQENTPSYEDLTAQLAADEAARHEPEPEPVEEPKIEAAEPEVAIEEVAHEDDEFEKRISRLAYEKRTAEKEARQLRERIARLEGNAPALPKDDEVAQLVEQRAAQIAADNAYNNKANDIYKAGVAAYPDFETKLVGLRELGGVSPQLVEAADEIGDAHKIIHYLGKNLDEAERIIAMAPHKMGAALGRIAAKISAPPPPKQQSKAPAPIAPLAGRANAEVTDENMPIDEWMRREDERMANRRGRW